jgi:hypothetical protein
MTYINNNNLISSAEHFGYGALSRLVRISCLTHLVSRSSSLK